ncbi:MAG TPA: thiol-disulfide oxidoreductase DCC family protein [Geopsychrobacteraceae bacterium]|jgi:predicted DCC family thiol-disulfide oxidoreductase YuxK
MEEHPIILFDGECNLCDRAVQFIIRRDPRARFRFAALQSPAGERLLAEHGLQGLESETMVLIDRGKVYLRSDAALQISRRLSGGWPLVALLRFLPRALRDGCYRWIATRRFAWFGRKTSCLLPTPELRRRFLDNTKGNEPDVR